MSTFSRGSFVASFDEQWSTIRKKNAISHHSRGINANRYKFFIIESGVFPEFAGKITFIRGYETWFPVIFCDRQVALDEELAATLVTAVCPGFWWWRLWAVVPREKQILNCQLCFFSFPINPISLDHFVLTDSVAVLSSSGSVLKKPSPDEILVVKFASPRCQVLSHDGLRGDFLSEFGVSALGAWADFGRCRLMNKTCIDIRFWGDLVISGLKIVDFKVTSFDPYSHYVVRPVTVNRPGEKCNIGQKMGSPMAYGHLNGV